MILGDEQLGGSAEYKTNSSLRGLIRDLAGTSATLDASHRVRSYKKTCWSLRTESDRPLSSKLSVLPGFSLPPMSSENS